MQEVFNFSYVAHKSGYFCVFVLAKAYILHRIADSIHFDLSN